MRFVWDIPEPASEQISHEAGLMLAVLATTDRRCRPSAFLQTLEKAGVDIRLDCAVACCNHMKKRGRRCCMADLPAVPVASTGRAGERGAPCAALASPQRC